ncbi:hypothetical protein EHM92_07545 [bacterium]|nr:MAG: hypothetical protein EHM92_07545 [bacterium]
MNACSARKKDLALLAAQALESAAAEPLRRHLAECAPCRRYWQEMSLLCREHASVLEEIPQLPASMAFHEKLLRRIRTQGRAAWRRPGPSWFDFFRGWRPAPAWAGAGLAVLCLILFYSLPKTHHSNPVARGPEPKSQSVVQANPPESLISYRLAVNDSFESLDALLARNSAAPAPSQMRISAAMRFQDALTE